MIVKELLLKLKNIDLNAKIGIKSIDENENIRGNSIFFITENRNDIEVGDNNMDYYIF